MITLCFLIWYKSTETCFLVTNQMLYDDEPGTAYCTVLIWGTGEAIFHLRVPTLKCFVTETEKDHSTYLRFTTF